MPNHPKRTLSQRKFVEWLLVSAALSVLGAFLIYAYLAEVDRVNSTERDRLHVVENFIANDVQGNLATVNHVLAGVVQDYFDAPITPESPKYLTLRLQALEGAIPGIRALLVLDDKGMVTYSSKASLAGMDFSYLDCFKTVRDRPNKTTLYISAPFPWLKEESNLVITASRMVQSPHGEYAGMVVAVLDQEYFASSFKMVIYAPDVWGFVVHGDGQQMFNFPEKKGIDGTDLNKPDTFFSRHRQSGQIESLQSGKIYTTGEQRLMALRTIQPDALHMDKAIVIGISRELPAIALPLQRQAITFSTFFLAVGFICCAMLYWMQTRRSRFETLRAALEQERLEANERIKLALRGANLALWSVHVPTNAKWFDENCFAVLGLASRNVDGDPDFFRKRIHPDDRAPYLSKMDACIDGSRPLLEATFRMQHCSGRWIWVLTRGQAIERDDSGYAVTLMGTFFDISATKSAEQEVIRARNELQAIFDNMTEAVLVFDNDQTVIRANRAARSILGLFDPTLTLEEVWTSIEVCLPNGDILPQEDWPTRRGFRGDYVRNLELQIRRKDSGDAVFIEISVTPVYDEAEKVSLLIATYSNVSERRFTHALRESEARFRTLIEDAPLAIAILRRGHFVYTNSRYNILHGYLPTDDLSGLPWANMISEESHKVLRTQEILINEDSPTEQKFEAEGLCKDGKSVPVFKTTTCVELLEGPATLIFAQDISTQKRAEAALLDARDAAEAANRSKADFLANMSHEIRTPLNAIVGMAYLIDQVPLDPDTHNMVRKIRASGRMLLGIINDILDVSKIEAGHTVIEQVPFRLDDVVDNLAATMSIAVGEKNIQLIIHSLPPGISSLVGDPLRLEQVLTNLASNAIKFTQVGCVELRISLLSRVEDVAVLRFSVQDTGIGIAPELQADVFSPFTQADSSTTRRFGGTGLGLTICRQLVDLMGGEIGLVSEPGQGSEFWFTLPLQLVANSNFSSPSMVKVDALIADDSEIALKAVSDIAAGLGWHVSAVQSGREALAQIQKRQGGKLPDVVILDWKMPDMDGLATARAIRECLAEVECPIVIMATAYSLSNLASLPGADVVDAILNKPVTNSALYNATVEAQRRRGATIDTSHLLPKTTNQSLAGVRVLIVDDSDINREVARCILCGQGATASLAVDGKDALEWLQAHSNEVDLVLMDVQMPIMDGLEATRQLRRMPQFKDLPIVALTAGAFKSQQEAARAAGMTHFVSKPFDVSTVTSLIQRLTRRPGIRASDIFDIDKTSPDQHVAEPSADSPAIDIAAGLRIWSDVQNYGEYLRRFAGSYGNAVATINISLANGNREAAMALVHKLAGVSANMALPGTHRLAQEAERVMSRGYDPTLILGRLAESLAQVMAEIDRFAPSVEIDLPTSPTLPVTHNMTSEIRNEVEKALAEMLIALETDNPAPVEPILFRLSGLLQTPMLANIDECVRNFDFSGAKKNALALATELGIVLEHAQ